MAKKQYLHLLAACIGVAVVTRFFTLRRYVDLPLVPPRLIVNTGDASTFLAFCPDGSTLLSASGARAQLKDIDTGMVRCNLEGHRKSVTDVAVSPNGLMAVTGSQDGSVRLWELPSGQPLRVFKGEHGFVASVTAHNAWVAAGFEDGTILVWSRDGQQLAQFKDHLASVTDLAVRPNDEALISCCAGDGTVKVHRIPDGKLLANYKTYREAPGALACSPQGTRIACADEKGRIYLWSTESPDAVISPLIPGGVHSLAFEGESTLLAAGEAYSSPGGVYRWSPGKNPAKLAGVDCDGTFALSAGRTTLACNSNHKAVDVWDLSSLHKQHSIPEQPQLGTVQFTSDGARLVVGATNRTFIWSLQGAPLQALVGGEPLALSGQRAVLHVDEEHDLLRLVDLARPEATAPEVKLPDYLEWVTLSEDGRQVFFPGAGESIHQADATSGKLERIFQTQDYGNRLALAPDWLVLKCSDEDRKDFLQFVARQSGRRWKLPCGDIFAQDLRFSPDVTRLAQVGEGILELYDVQAKKLVTQVKQPGKESYTWRCRFSPDSSKLAFNADPNLLLLDGKTGRQIRSGQVAVDFTFSPDSASLATLGAGGLAIEEVATGQRRVLDPVPETAGALAYSPDGKLLAVSNSWSVRLFDPIKGEQLATLIVLQPGDEWLVVTPGGLYDCSAGASRRLAWRMGDKTYRLDQFARLFEQKGLLARLMAGERPKPVQHLLHPPPRVEIASLQPEQEVSQADLEVAVWSREEGGGIGKVHLEVNGVEAPPLPGKARVSFPVHLKPGPNHLRAYASDAGDLMLSASAELTVFLRSSDPAPNAGQSPDPRGSN